MEPFSICLAARPVPLHDIILSKVQDSPKPANAELKFLPAHFSQSAKSPD